MFDSDTRPWSRGDAQRQRNESFGCNSNTVHGRIATRRCGCGHRYLQESKICDFFAHYQHFVALYNAAVTEMMPDWMERSVKDNHEGIEQLRRQSVDLQTELSRRRGVLERAQLDVQHTEEEIMKNQQKLH